MTVSNPGPTCMYKLSIDSITLTCKLSSFPTQKGFNDASTKGPYPRLFSKLRIKSASPWPFFCVVMWLVENHLPRVTMRTPQHWATVAQILHQLMLVEGLIRTSHMVQDFNDQQSLKILWRVEQINEHLAGWGCTLIWHDGLGNDMNLDLCPEACSGWSVSQLVPLLMKEETIDYIWLRGPPPSMAFFSSGRFQCLPLFSEQISFPTSSLQTSLCEGRILQLIDDGSSCNVSPVTQLFLKQLKTKNTEYANV